MVNTKLDIHICGPINGLPFWPTSIYPWFIHHRYITIFNHIFHHFPIIFHSFPIIFHRFPIISHEFPMNFPWHHQCFTKHCSGADHPGPGPTGAASACRCDPWEGGLWPIKGPNNGHAMCFGECGVYIYIYIYIYYYYYHIYILSYIYIIIYIYTLQ